MLLRSASTPILGSLLASSSCAVPYFYESPNHGAAGGSGNPLERTHSDTLHKLSFHPHGGAAAHGPHLNAAASYHAFSCQFSPSPAAPEVGPFAGGSFRRVCSDGNLQDLAGVDCLDEPRRRPNQQQHFPAAGYRRATVLKTIPSFSFQSSKEREDNPDVVAEVEGIEEEEEARNKCRIERSVTIGESFSGELFPGDKASAVGNAGEEPVAAPLFLARGLGLGVGDAGSGLIVGFGDGAGGRGGEHPVTLGNGGEQSDMEAYYKKMVEEDPNNALFLRNYARFLYQSKGDPQRAEEYYSRAILAEPGDGEVLSQYAKLIWELHRDHERANSYFEQAVQASPQDSHVLAAYASFLWDTEDEQDGDEEVAGLPGDYAGTQVSYGALASAHV
ncbi:hypothetical protein Taro_027111 [Colocasia esculenta]|uniref:TmcB/TmcC TPR repeats domain-containing protein n=1 Tax=Colocasia esculenta TaxID=4460 RepID=A0A843VTC6_COLES|nr:hypothetical protein [Colocasia esculenta]